MQFCRSSRLLAAFCALSFAATAVADNTYHDLSAGDFSQDWTNTGLITANDVWSGVPSIIGYRGDGLATGTGADPQTILGVGTPVEDVNANQTNPNSFSTGGVAEFELPNPAVALAGSGTAKAPSIIIHLNSSGRENIHVAYALRDLETGADTGVQKVALQYRTSESVDFVNVPEGYVGAATNPTTPPTTQVSVDLPADASDQATLQIRIITTDAASNDRWVGIDDISVTSAAIPSGPSDLFFSEYIEGSSNNKALEIFNGTGEAVDLANYKIRIEGFTNAGGVLTPATLTFTSPTPLADGDAYVVCNNSANTALSAFCDLKTTNGALSFTGDDSLTLLHTIEGVDTVIDIIGQVGVDPGDKWGTDPTSTQNNTIRRKPVVCVGDTNGADVFDPSVEWDGFAIDTFDGLGTHAVDCGGGPEEPTLPIVSFAAGTVSAAEGDDTANALTFAVEFTQIAEGETLSFDIAVSGTAGRYSYAGPASVTLDDEAVSPYIVEVATVPNTDTDGNATVTVTLSNFVGADASQTTPLTKDGSIFDDDAAFTKISAIQGSGQASPLPNGSTVTTRGIVTAVTTAGRFFLQSLPGDVDEDPETSEGLFVYGIPSPSVALAAGDYVYVTGNLSEYIPATGGLPITELVAPVSVTKVSSDNALPEPVVLTAADTDPAGPIGKLERYEFMRVTVPSFVATAPTGPGAADEFFGVIEGIARPFREAGVDAFRCGVDPAIPGSQPLPAEAPANVPCWDNNPELLRVKTNLLVGGATTPVRTGTKFQNLTGVLDYAFNRYSIVTRSTVEPAVVDTSAAEDGTPVSTPSATDITIGGYNVENLALAGGTTYNRKADKIARTIVEYLNTPDVLGLIEVANLETLEDIASRVGTIAANDPQYQAVLLSTEGTQRLGFLLKRSLVGGTPRVTVVGTPAEYGAGLHVLCPDGVSYTTGLLNDRPPLVIDVLIRGPNGVDFPVTVINNHLKSLIGTDSTDDAGADYACFNDPQNPGGGEGRRNRAKRQQNAEFTAELVQTLQDEVPGRAIVLVGDFNAFQFNDGYADLVNTIAGTPAANDTTVVPDDGADLVNPDLAVLSQLADPQQAYSYTFEGNAQTIDQILASEGALAASVGLPRLEFARVNADFHQADATNDANAFGNSDHDPSLAFLDIARFRSANLSLDAEPVAATAQVGDTLEYAFTLSNDGPDEAAYATVELTLPGGVLFATLDAPEGWDCETPAVGSAGAVVCSIELMSVGEAQFTVTATVSAAASGSTVTATLEASTASTDPDTQGPITLPTEVVLLPDLIFGNGFED